MYFEEDFVLGAAESRRERARGARFVCFCREVAGANEENRRREECDCRCRCGRNRVRGEREGNCDDWEW